MYMDAVIESLINTGPMGGILIGMGFFIYKQYTRSNSVMDKIINVVESNTKAMAELKDAQEQRRREFRKDD